MNFLGYFCFGGQEQLQSYPFLLQIVYIGQHIQNLGSLLLDHVYYCLDFFIWNSYCELDAELPLSGAGEMPGFNFWFNEGNFIGKNILSLQ